MPNLYKTALLFVLLPFGLLQSFGQKASLFVDKSESKIELNGAKRMIVPQKFRTVSLDFDAMKQFLWTLPEEKTVTNRAAAPVLMLPSPNGTFARFHVWESSIQAPELAAKFPDIKTFLGQGIDDPYATIRFDITPMGFHAQILSVNGSWYIDPYAAGLINDYISYYRTDLIKPRAMECQVPTDAIAPHFNTSNTLESTTAGPCRGSQLYTYRLAVACTGEYAQAPGVAAGTNPAILHAAIVTTVNRVVGVYEKEVAVRMVLVANNDIIEYLNASTDPFNGNNSAGVLINESQTVIDNNIGSANYDIGHTFSTGGGGLAQLGCVCGGSKARGITGSPSPTGDAYDIDYVAHEMGHQFGGSHTFNSTTGSCNGNRSATSAYEVGSGTTIQAYAGICSSDNIQMNSDPFFHTRSFDQISSFLEAGGASCRVVTSTGNSLPSITAMQNAGVAIPPSTPFTLNATATDPDGNPLTYCWEEWDLGPATAWNGGNANTTSPLFKSRVPKTTGARTFPDMAVILANYPAAPAATMGGLKGEILPTQARTLKFRLTVRDNNAGGGGVVTGGDGCQTGFTGIYSISVSGTTPFTVTVPNGGESYPGNSTQTITWNNAGTNAAPYNVGDVKISLSTDGGLTYPTVLLASTPNDGSEAVTIPAVGPISTARIKIEAIGNIFFDISNANFSITAPVGPSFSFNTPAPSSGCQGAASISSTVTTNNIGGFTTPINLTAIGNPGGTTVSFSPNPMSAGNSTVVTLNNTGSLAPGTYNVTVTGIGGTITQTVVVSFVVTSSTSITTQPANANVCSGNTATFSVTASGAGLSYQWQLSTTGCTGTFADIAGATSATYTTGATTTGMNGYAYRVIVSSTCSAAVTSSCATLSIAQSTSITSQPVSQTVCEGSPASFNVAANGTNLTYQWQLSTDGGVIFNNIAGANAATYTIPAASFAQNNYKYRVLINGLCGNVTSTIITLTVNPAVSITAQPVGAAICSGTNNTFTAVAFGTSLTYQWQQSTTGCGGTFTNIAGATNASLVLTSVTPAMNGYAYRVVVSGACGSSVTSACAPLTVYTTAIINTQPANQSACAGNTAFFNVNASGTGLSYQWQQSSNGGSSFANIPGATSATYAIMATSAMNGYQYRVLVTSTCNVNGTMSAAATLTVNNPVSIVKNPDSAKGCDGGSAMFRVIATGTGLSYQWQASFAGSPYVNIPGATDSILVLSNLTTAMDGTMYQVVVTGNPCGLRITTPVKLKVAKLPVVTLNTNSFTSTPNSPAILYPTTSDNAYFTYQWFKNDILQPQTGTQLSVSVDSLGYYKVVGTNTVTGCSDTSNVLRISAKPTNELYIYPSPNSGKFYVRYYDSTAKAKRVLNIYDDKGALVYQKQFVNAINYQRMDVVILWPRSGIYFVDVRDVSGNRLALGRVKIVK